MPHTIHLLVVPETGWHLFRIPLICEDPNLPHLAKTRKGVDPAALAALEAAAKQGTWDSDWTDSPETPWIKVRRAQWSTPSDTSVCGLHVAIDTTLGDENRGLVLDQKATPAGFMEPARLEWRGKAMSNFPVNPPPTAPYAATDNKDLNSRKFSYTYSEKSLPVAKFEIVFEQTGAVNDIPVDLAIDLGNSRTSVIATEDRPVADFAQRIRPIRFTSPWEPYQSTGQVLPEDCIPDTWFILQEPSLSNMAATIYQRSISTHEEGLFFKSVVIDQDELRTSRAQQFNEISPCIMGPEATRLAANTKIDGNSRYSLSSPKRYLWDTEASEKNLFWTMRYASGRKPAKGEFPKLAGEMLRYFPVNDRPWDIRNPPFSWPSHEQPTANAGGTPNHCPSQTMAWLALHILETTARQINSEEWRKEMKMVPRYLRHVTLSFPPGWTSGERQIFQRRWQEAADIFALSRLKPEQYPPEPSTDAQRPAWFKCNRRPIVKLGLDEAAAAQFPFVYNEIASFHDDADELTALLGHKIQDQDRLRVCSIDIGGGTSDITVMDYVDELPGAGIHLKITPRFRDSLNLAGDDILRQIVAEVLLPALVNNDPADLEKLRILFGVNPDSQSIHVLRSALLPVARRWLQDLGQGTEGNPETGNYWTPAEILKMDQSAWDLVIDLWNSKGLTPHGVDAPIDVSYATLHARIRELFKIAVRNWASIAASWACDVLFVSGKPSEVKVLQELIREEFTLPLNRIHFAKGLRVGPWFPMRSDQGAIKDAKLVTAVGQSLYAHIAVGNQDGFSIEFAADAQSQFRQSWGLDMDGRNGGFKPKDVLLGSGKDSCDFKMVITTKGSLISRQLIPGVGREEPVYRLRCHAAHIDKFKTPCTVSLQRTQSSDSEGLELLSVKNSSGQELKDWVQFGLCTLREEQHWVDTGHVYNT